MPKQRGEIYLYHYTTAEGLIGIVRNRNIWATEVFHLNDWEEFLGGINLAHEYLVRLRKEAATRTDESGVERFDWLIQGIDRIGPGQSLRRYVSSFSKEHDELSQWRAYCPSGGFSIGFPKKRLVALAKKQGFVLKKCIYELDKQIEVIESTVDRAMQQGPSQQQILLAGPGAESLIRCTLSNKLIWELARVCPILKNVAFKREVEWRLISEPRSGGEHNQIQFRSKNGMVIPYKEFTLNDAELWRKVRVTVGPSPHPEESHASVYQLLRCHTGFAHAITNTSASYRAW